MSPAVYGCCGLWITSCTGPISTMRPAYITATRSAVSAITPMSCVTSITAVPFSRQRLLQELDDLRLDGDVERRGGLIGDDELGLGAQRERDHDALAHAAGELVRVVVDAPLGSRNADLGEQRDRSLPGGLVGHRQVRLDRLDDLAAHRVERIQRGERILEDRADAPPADLAHRLGRKVVDARAFQEDLAARDAPGGSSSPMIAVPVSDFPAPDSPTTPRTSPWAMSKLTSSMAMSVPRRVLNSTRRLRTWRSGALTSLRWTRC